MKPNLCKNLFDRCIKIAVMVQSINKLEDLLLLLSKWENIKKSRAWVPSGHMRQIINQNAYKKVTEAIWKIKLKGRTRMNQLGKKSMLSTTKENRIVTKIPLLKIYYTNGCLKQLEKQCTQKA